MSTPFISSTSKPTLIYMLSTDLSTHKGCLKIGQTTCNSTRQEDMEQAARRRIDQYMGTAGVKYNLMHVESTLHMRNGEVLNFRDSDVHEVLRRSGIQRKRFGQGVTAQEWFVCDLQTAIAAIAAAKKGLNALTPDAVCQEKETPTIVLRPEQRAAIDKTKACFEKSDKMLWDAKMRFGKTLTALQLVKELAFKKTIILTHRPEVDKGWFEDFDNIFHDGDGYLFGSKQKGEKLDTLMKSKQSFIYFASQQDLRGSQWVGGRFEKNDEIFEETWDLLIIDEAHEGMTTDKGKAVTKALRKRKTKLLCLTGTAYDLLDDFEQQQIYTWDYAMEQEAKQRWDKEHLAEPNPYAVLPRMNMRLLSLAQSIKKDNAFFTFAEFFRTNDNAQFVHHDDVAAFLNRLSDNSDNHYPFANDEYRNTFRHTLWVMPGVKAARAMSLMLRKHPVFKYFNIANVAGEGDEEDPEKEAMAKVRAAITDNPGATRSITLTCGAGRLTTGVTVPQWTAVLMLYGSADTSAKSYMQTIFRVQSPGTIDGHTKTDCYVFDFAPDRALNVLHEDAQAKAKAQAGTHTDNDGTDTVYNQQNAATTSLTPTYTQAERTMRFMPVIAYDGADTRRYDVQQLITQIRRIHIEHVVSSGFADNRLFDMKALTADNINVNDFNELQKIVGSTQGAPKTQKITLNQHKLTPEEKQQATDAEKKQQQGKTLTEEETRLLRQLQEEKKARDNAANILKAVAIRLPLLIYGATLPEQNNMKNFSLKVFVNGVDNASWAEFMPRGVTKKLFGRFYQYFDQDIFAAASQRVHQLVREADDFSTEQRIERITQLFATFKNPDKETVLTPWRVVNMHLSDTIGGYCFYNEAFDTTLDKPRHVQRDDITANVFNRLTRILEINSKTGLYPLYCAYTLYRQRLETQAHATPEQHQALWDEAIRDNIFVICRTKMAASITRRTLAGFRKGVRMNIRYYEHEVEVSDLVAAGVLKKDSEGVTREGRTYLLNGKATKPCDMIDVLRAKPALFQEDVVRGTDFWHVYSQIPTNKQEDINNMKFNAIIGNPPYQVMDGGAGASAMPIYHLFISAAKKLNPYAISVIMPSKWFAGGKGLDEFREETRLDERFEYIRDFINSKELFPSASIGGGICFFLWRSSHCGPCKFTNVLLGRESTKIRFLNQYDTIVRHNEAIDIIDKMMKEGTKTISDIMLSRNPFGISSNLRGSESQSPGLITLLTSDGLYYVDPGTISENRQYVETWKVSISKVTSEHAGEPDKNGQVKILSSLRTLGPNTCCTDSYLIIGKFQEKREADNLRKYLATRYARFMLLLAVSSINLSKEKFKFVPLQDFTPNSDIDWSRSIDEIDEQLFDKYGLDEGERAFIRKMIKPMQ